MAYGPPGTELLWRGMIGFVLLCGSLYTVRNGLLNLLLDQYIRGWGWLCVALLFGQLAAFALWLGLGVM
jgi:hypothetical protein